MVTGLAGRERGSARRPGSCSQPGPGSSCGRLALTRAFYLLDTHPSLSPPPLPPIAPFTWGPSLHPFNPTHPVRCPCCSQSPVRAFVGAHAESGPWGLAGLWPVACGRTQRVGENERQILKATLTLGRISQFLMRLIFQTPVDFICVHLNFNLNAQVEAHSCESVTAHGK